jgi:nitroalkane oxidase
MWVGDGPNSRLLIGYVLAPDLTVRDEEALLRRVIVDRLHLCVADKIQQCHICQFQPPVVCCVFAQRELGWNGEGAELLTVVCRTDANVEPSRGISIIAVPRPGSGLIFEHAFDTLGHRAHLMPRFRLDAVPVPAGNLLGHEGRGLQLAAESFAGSAALVGIFGVALMRAAFQLALSFAKSDRRGGIQQIIQHQAVGYALADAKTTIEAARALSWHACRSFDTAAPGALELAIHAKVFGSEAAVRVITNLMQVVGVDSYGHELPLAGLLQDAMALPLFAGGNIGVRRRQLHALMLDPVYDDLATLDGVCLAETVP